MTFQVAIGFKKTVILYFSLFLLCIGLLACGSQEAPKEAKENAAPAAAPPATPAAAPAGEATTPKTVEAFIGQGKASLAAKQYDQAIVSFSEAIKLDPQSVVAHNNRGVAYCNKENLDQAISDFSRVIELDPKNGKAYNNRAVAYFMKKDLDKARQDVEKAQSLGIPVSQMLIDSLNPGAAMLGRPALGPVTETLPPGVSMTPVKPEDLPKPEGQAKPKSKGKPDAKGKAKLPDKGETPKN